MKKILFSFLFLFAVGLTTNAQSKAKAETTEKKTTVVALPAKLEKKTKAEEEAKETVKPTKYLIIPTDKIEAERKTEAKKKKIEG